jgi:L-aspartate oxidase
VFAERVARDMGSTPALGGDPPNVAWSVPPLPDRGAAQVAANAIRDALWQYAGISRTADGLRTCMRLLDDLESRLPAGATEELNMVEAARLIAEAALLRQESRGGHYRSDFPAAKRTWEGRRIVW